MVASALFVLFFFVPSISALLAEEQIHALRQMEGLRPPSSLWEAQKLQDTLLRRLRRLRNIGGVPGRRHAHVSLYEAQHHQPSEVLLTPVQFGADPTGTRDSTTAFHDAIRTMLSICDERSFFNVDMADTIKNCGSVTLDLEGGEYIISKPINVPLYYGNIHIERGMLRASPTFPREWMIQVGGGDCRTNGPQRCCNEFVNFKDLFLDASHVAAGGIRIMATMGSVISSCFLTGFRDVGIKIDGGHEIMITNCWLAEYYWSDVRIPDVHSIGIQLNGPDHILSNIILFDYSHIGVEVGTDGGNLLEGVHIWNGSGTGFLIKGATRITDCFVDYNKMVLVDPNYVVIEDTYFYHTYLSVNVSETGSMNNVMMIGNQYGFVQPGKTIRIEGGTLENVTNVVIDNEIGGNVFTSVKTSLHQTDKMQFQFNLTDVLLVPTIKHLLYSVVWDDSIHYYGTSSPIYHKAQKPDDGIVTIEFGEPVNATVMLDVSVSDTCLPASESSSMILLPR